MFYEALRGETRSAFPYPTRDALAPPVNKLGRRRGWGAFGGAKLLARQPFDPPTCPPPSAREIDPDAARFHHNGACDIVRRGRSDWTRADLPRGHRGPAAPRAPRCRRARKSHRRRDPDRHRAPRRSSCFARSAFRYPPSASPAACCCSRSRLRWCSACACAAKDKRPKRRSRSMCATSPPSRSPFR